MIQSHTYPFASDFCANCGREIVKGDTVFTEPIDRGAANCSHGCAEEYHDSLRQEPELYLADDYPD